MTTREELSRALGKAHEAWQAKWEPVTDVADPVDGDTQYPETYVDMDAGVDADTEFWAAVAQVLDGTVPVEAADWKESDHPRDPDGRFGHGGGGHTPKTGGYSPPVKVSPDWVEKFQHGSAVKHLVKAPDGSWEFTPERRALHAKIVEDALRGKEGQDHPVYYFLGGGTASGKSSLIEAGIAPDLVKGTDQGVTINNDEIKPLLPEYKEVWKKTPDKAASFTHEEASYVTSLIRAEAFDRKLDVVLDGIGDSSSDSVRQKVDQARSKGYKVDAYYCTVPTKTAAERAAYRAQQTGRYVPETVLRHTHAAVSKVFDDIVPMFDDVALYDTRNRGVNPTLIFQKTPDDVRVVDPVLMDDFRSKAEEG